MSLRRVLLVGAAGALFGMPVVAQVVRAPGVMAAPPGSPPGTGTFGTPAGSIGTPGIVGGTPGIGVGTPGANAGTPGIVGGTPGSVLPPNPGAVLPPPVGEPPAQSDATGIVPFPTKPIPPPLGSQPGVWSPDLPDSQMGWDQPGTIP